MDFAQADALNQAIRRISQMHQSLAYAVLADLGLHPGQALFLLELDVHGTRTQIQLAAGLGVEPPSITGMAVKLQAAGLIARTHAPRDARAMIVELTEEGRALIPRVKEKWVRLAEESVAGLDTTRLDGLTRELLDLAHSLSLDGPPHRTTSAPTGDDDC